MISAQDVKYLCWRRLIFIAASLSALLLVGVLVGNVWWNLEKMNERLELDWKYISLYLRVQEDFLHELQKQSEKLDDFLIVNHGEVYELNSSSEDKRIGAGFEFTFDINCGDELICSEDKEFVGLLGSGFYDFYESYWASSFFSSPLVFIISRAEDLSVRVSSLQVNLNLPTDNHDFYRITEKIIDIVRDMSVVDQLKDIEHSEVKWFRMLGVPGKLVGFEKLEFFTNLLRSGSGGTTDIFVATVLNINGMNSQLMSGVNIPSYLFWLLNEDGEILLGSGSVPKASTLGFSYNLEGMHWKFYDSDSERSVVYYIGYQDFFSNYWSLLGWILLCLAILLVLGLWSCYRCRRDIAERMKKSICIESLHQILIEAAPVGFCLLSKEMNKVIFSNALAGKWLGLKIGAQVSEELAKELRLQMHLENSSTEVITLRIYGRDLSVAYLWVTYNGQRVIVCVITDMTIRGKTESELQKAKKDADEEIQSKSLILAAMGSEIRTPLYNLQKAVDSLSDTHLTNQQNMYIKSIEEEIDLLLQLVSDFLDLERINTGELLLEKRTFSPLELVQSCVRSYTSIAKQKGLIIFSCVDTDVPDLLEGDSVRIRQILNNLISNAIKFTAAGRVVVQVRCLELSCGFAELYFEVCDTGIGIKKDQQEEIFRSFFSKENQSSELSSACLGLSICEGLARVMGSSIQVRSEYKIGSCFSLNLRLKVDVLTSNNAPNLIGSYVIVRTPCEILTKSISAWLALWGADIGNPINGTMTPRTRSAWIDIFMTRNDVPQDGVGEYLSLEPIIGESTHPEIDGQSIWSIGRGLVKVFSQTLSVPALGEEEPQALSLKVLLAEENSCMQVALSDQLKQLGCEVTLAEDGEDALACWDMARYDVVLTDVNMQRLNGYELARILRAEGATCPIFGIAANAKPDEQQRCLEAGMNAYMEKPIHLHTLWQMLRKTQEAVLPRCISSDDVNVVKVPAKYRDLFINTMLQDIEVLAQALELEAVESVVFSLHRMAGALAEVQQERLMDEFRDLEVKVKKSGLTMEICIEINTLIDNCRHFLTKI